MLLSHQKNYNPKIDYLVCRNLIKDLPWEHDEQRLRKVYDEELIPKCKYERDLLKIKDFFREHDIAAFTKLEIEFLYFTITGHLIIIDDMTLNGVESVADIDNLVKCVENVTVCDRDVLFQIALLVNYSLKHDTPIVPYAGVCRKLYWSIIIGDDLQAQRRFRYLIYKIEKYSQKHALEQNKDAVETLYLHKDEFLQRFGANQIGIYGSLASGSGNEYSDLDILIIFPNDAPVEAMHGEISQYWESIIDIPIDVTALVEREITTKIHPSIQQTLKLL